eukprot:jgi/Psemu1/15843/gm1.15843_g
MPNIKALGSIPIHWSSGEARCPTAHSTSSCGTAQSWEDHKETPVSELPGCMDDEGGTMEQNKSTSMITRKLYRNLLVVVRGMCGKRDKEIINKSGAKQERHKRLKTKHNWAKGKDTGMTVMEGNSHTQNGMEGNSKTQAGINEDEKESDVSDESSIDVKNPYPTGQDHHIRLKTNHNSANDETRASLNEDEEDSDVSDDSSIDVKNPYPTCHHFPTAVREENKRNKTIDRLIARVNWNALQLKIGLHCMHICHHQTSIENLQTVRRAILHSVKMLAETLESFPFPELL